MNVWVLQSFIKFWKKTDSLPLTLIGTRFLPHVKNQGGGKKTPQRKICNISGVWCPISMKFSQFIARWIWHTTALKYLSYHFGWPHKWRSSQGHTWKKMTWPVLLIWSSQKFEFMTIFMFSKGEESIFDIITELPCLGDLENPDQLPVQEVLEGTDDCVL